MLSLDPPRTPPKKDLTTPNAAGVPCSSVVKANGPEVGLEEDGFRRRILVEGVEEDEAEGEEEDPLDPPPLFPPNADRSLDPNRPSEPPFPLVLPAPLLVTLGLVTGISKESKSLGTRRGAGALSVCKSGLAVSMTNRIENGG